MTTTPKPLRVVVLVSGNGSNLQAILDAAASGELPVQVAAVISNRPKAFALERARRVGVDTHVVDHRAYTERSAFDRALQQAIDRYDPQLVVLAGFMRIFTAELVRHYHGRMLNIHPSLLPALRGLDTHARALEQGAQRHGASVHFVTDELDGGPVVVQAEVPVRPDDTPERLGARVLEQEHRLYPLAIRWFAEGRLRLEDDTATLDGEPLRTPRRLGVDPAGASP